MHHNGSPNCRCIREYYLLVRMGNWHFQNTREPCSEILDNRSRQNTSILTRPDSLTACGVAYTHKEAFK